MKIGIVCDNYKLDKFREKLRAMGVGFKTSPFTKDTTTITVEASEDRLTEVKRICEEVEKWKEDSPK